MHVIVAMALIALCSGIPAAAQDMPAEYKQGMDALGQQGDYKDGVLKVNIPRIDLHVSVDGIATPTPFGFVSSGGKE